MACNNSLVTIVLPLYKPKGDWAAQFVNNIGKLDCFLTIAGQLQYIVIYDDKADSKLLSTFELISEELPHVRFINNGENKGKGYSLRQGVKLARTPYTITLDFDFPYKMENIATLVALLRANKYDIVIGKRSDAYFRQVPAKRWLLSKSFSLLNRLLLDLPLADTQSGIKGFNEKGKEVFLQTTIDRFLVDTEFVLRGAQQGLQIRTMNIELRSGIHFSNFGYPVLLTELKNFFKLIMLRSALKANRSPAPSYAAQKLPVH